MKNFLFPADLAFCMAFAAIIGIFSASAGWDTHLTCLIAATGAGVVLFFEKSAWKECLLVLAALAFGILYFFLFTHWEKIRTVLPTSKDATLAAIVADEPQPSQKYLLFSVNAKAPFAGNVKIFAPLASDIHYGDLLDLKGLIVPPSEKNPGFSMFSPHITLKARHKGWLIREWLIDLKLKILDIYKNALPADQAALLGGIAFGSKVSFKPELKAAMALSGTTHLVAVSGYNITIVLLAASGIFGRFLSHRITFFLATLLLILFILMVGFAASGVRAAIMGFMALVAKEAGEGFDMRNAITFTALFMALFDPAILTGNLSFILSFLSLLGIVYIKPPLQKLFSQTESGMFDWKENAITTLSAQLAVMPVLIRTFGQFSAIAILANILVLGTVPLTMFLGLLLAFVGFVSISLAFFVAKLTSLILFYELWIIRFFASFALPLPISFKSDMAMAFYYVAIGIFIFKHGGAQKI